MMPKSKFLRQERNDIYELIKESNIPSFVTNITMKFYSNDRVNVPITDPIATQTFYALFKEKNRKEFELIKGIV